MKWPAQRMNTQRDKGFGVYPEAASLEREGADVIHLEVGRPAFDTPPHIKQAAKDALDAGIVHYGDLQGTAALRVALAGKLERDNRLSVSEDEILVTTGLTQASFATFAAALDPGDEVVVLEPRYPQHPPKIELMGASVRSVPLEGGRGFRLDTERLEAAISSRTTALVLVNPANPTGTVFSLEELRGLADVAIRHDLLVVSDEVYEFITYDGRSHNSIAALPGMWDRTVSLFAFTKAYAMDGWRLGYAVAPRPLIADIQRVTMNETTHPNVFAQEGAIAAVEGPQEPVREMVAEDQRCRDLAYERLNAMPGVDCHLPEGSIYAFPNVSGLGLTAKEFAYRLLHERHVAVEPGTSYGPSGEGHVRVCFGSEPYDRLVEGLDRIERFTKGLESR